MKEETRKIYICEICGEESELITDIKRYHSSGFLTWKELLGRNVPIRHQKIIRK